MDYQEVDATREFVARLEHGEDWRAQIEAFAADEGIDSAFFFGLGAVQDAELAFYDQNTQEYDSIVFEEPLEVVPAVGNVSTLDGEPFAHTHVALSRPDGTTVAGHLDSATTFAGELYLRAFDADLVRERDPVTDLDLWNL
jgi:predicted DNA-binding protein with PD1-like motif